MSFCSDYDFEIERIVSEIRRVNARRILIQLPEGFQRCFPQIAEEISSRVRDAILYLTLNPSYGACLVDENAAREVGAELIIHFGHIPYPTYRPSIPTLFIPVEYVRIDYSWLERALSRYSNSTVYTTAQHLRTVSRLCRDLNMVFGGVVLGCWMRKPLTERIVIVSGGLTQCLAAQLMNPRIETVCIDPYSHRIEVIDSRRVLGARLWKVSKAFDARTLLVIDGMYGQSRPEIVRRIIGEAQRVGTKVWVAKVLRLDESVLRNLELESYDAIVVASCPRIAVDDLAHLETPVLTPGEALAALAKDLERYVYPW